MAGEVIEFRDLFGVAAVLATEFETTTEGSIAASNG